ncbi:2353_t:CDS:1, partial [Gigaspora rosea]
DWKSTQQENTFLKDQAATLQTKLDTYEKIGGIKDQLEARILAKQQAYRQTIKDLQNKLNSAKKFISQQAVEIGNAQKYTKQFEDE